MKKLFTTRPILSFILITFGITFLFWFMPVMVNLPKDVAFALMLIGGCGPLIAGHILTVVNSGAKFKMGSKSIFALIFLGALIVLGFRLFLTNNGLDDGNGGIPTLEEIDILGYILMGFVIFLLAFNISNATRDDLKENYISSFLAKKSLLKWYLIAILLLPVMSVSSYYIGQVAGMEVSDSVVQLDATWFVGLFSTFFFFGGNEEFGWRGFLQKELQKNTNPLLAALFISFFWSLWHLPLHYNGFYSTGGIMDLLPRFIWTVPLTIVFTWMYNKSRYSVLALVIFHAMLNNNGKAFGASDTVFLVFAILLMVFCIFHDKMWKKKAYHSVYQEE